MLRYLFISILLATSVTAVAQSSRISSMGNAIGANQSSSNQQRNDDDEEDRPAEPKVTVIKDQGLALGIDLSPFITHFINKENTGLAFTGRYGFKNVWWASAEIGYQNTKYNRDVTKADGQEQETTLAYKSNGTFIKVGLDYDLFNSEDFPVNDNILIGFRYGYAWQNHEAENFTIIDDYWGSYKGSVGKTPVNSHFLEALFGLRCEVLRNFYMGWSFRFRLLLASTHNNQLDPYSIPGFGSYDSRAALGFTYTLEYQIPFNKLGKNKNK